MESDGVCGGGSDCFCSCSPVACVPLEKYRVVERQVRIGNGEGLDEFHSMDTHMGPSQQRDRTGHTSSNIGRRGGVDVQEEEWRQSKRKNRYFSCRTVSNCRLTAKRRAFATCAALVKSAAGHSTRPRRLEWTPFPRVKRRECGSGHKGLRVQRQVPS